MRAVMRDSYQGCNKRDETEGDAGRRIKELRKLTGVTKLAIGKEASIDDFVDELAAVEADARRYIWVLPNLFQCFWRGLLGKNIDVLGVLV